MKRTMNYRQFAWILGTMIAVFLILYLILNNQLGAKLHQENTLQVTLTRLDEKNKEMEAELQLVDTEDYVVSSAMTNYAFMNKNDLRFQFINPEALYAYTEEELRIYLDEVSD